LPIHPKISPPRSSELVTVQRVNLASSCDAQFMVDEKMLDLQGFLAVFYLTQEI
jgi:hypothetical protein